MDQIPLQLDRERIKEREDGEGGGDYLRGAIISNMSIKGGGDYSRDGYYSRKYASHASQQTTTITNLAVIACRLERLMISYRRKLL